MSGLDWAAGLFEGEGTITSCRGRRRIAIRMIREETLTRFHDEMGCGRLYGPYDNGPGRQKVFMWVAEEEDAERVIAALFPRVSEWRREAMVRLFPDIVGESVAA